MPAVTVEDTTALPRLSRPSYETTTAKPVVGITSAVSGTEGAGFKVWRGFAGMDFARLDPFVFMDQMGPVVNTPGQAKGAPWHPHRGFETVTYIMDGEMAHRDSNGGGGVIREGDTQWMTAGSGILHDELPSELVLRRGGKAHGIQLWVNLPSAQKWVDPRYQPIEGKEISLLTDAEGSNIVRLIAGELDGYKGPGVTYSPISYAHTSIFPGTRISVPWPKGYNSLVYVLSGKGFAGSERRPVRAHQLVEFGRGEYLTIEAAEFTETDQEGFEVILLGGKPIGEPVVQYGPFVMNTRAEIVQALEDYQAGKMGRVPASAI